MMLYFAAARGNYMKMQRTNIDAQNNVIITCELARSERLPIWLFECERMIEWFCGAHG